jgi:hypothetical protein
MALRMYYIRPPESHRTLWLYAPLRLLASGTDIPEGAGGERAAASEGRGKSSDSLMRHEWLGERAGKPAIPPGLARDTTQH